MDKTKYFLSSENTLDFYNANYCIKCKSTKYSQQYTKFEQATKESQEISAKQEGFLCCCFNCSFNWLAPISQKAYYTLEAAEQLECIKIFLDKANVPIHDENNKPYSYVGRIEQFAMSYAKTLRNALDEF